MPTRIIGIAALAATVTLLWAPVAMAQDAAPDFSKFSTACAGAQAFLLGDVPEGMDPKPLLDKLCSCLVTSFSAYKQIEIDTLTADLTSGDSSQSKSTYPDYDALQQKAGDALGACYSSPEIQALLPKDPATSDAPMDAAPSDAAPAADASSSAN